MTDIQDANTATENIMKNKQRLITASNTYCESMQKRGGGVVNIRCRVLAFDMIVVELLIDVREAMGANIVNTVCEGVSSLVQEVAQ